MADTPPAQALNRTPLPAFRALFAELATPDMATLPGFYRAAFAGPAWLRAIAPRGLALIHLRGWWGKEIRRDCTGANLVERAGRVQRSLPVQVSAGPSILDGMPAVAVRYPAGSPFPWPHVVDELRQFDEMTLLGMTIVDAGILRRLALPFLLHRAERPNGL